MLRIFYKQMHPLALLPSKGCCVLHMLQSALPTVHRLLLLVGSPCPQSHPLSPEPEPPQYPPKSNLVSCRPLLLMIPLPLILVIVTGRLIVMQTALPPLKP